MSIGMYDHRNCSSLFGYAADVHARSGGVCQLCGAGGQAIDFDFWRQLTVEHLIGAAQGGYLANIRKLVSELFPGLERDEAELLAREIDALNTVSACHFCNATTSRTRSPESMRDLFVQADGDPSALPRVVREAAAHMLAAKKKDVEWKLDSVRVGFRREVVPLLEAAR